MVCMVQGVVMVCRMEGVKCNVCRVEGVMVECLKYGPLHHTPLPPAILTPLSCTTHPSHQLSRPLSLASHTPPPSYPDLWRVFGDVAEG